MTTDQDSLHDSLTDAHQHSQSSPCQHVEMSAPSTLDPRGVHQHVMGSERQPLVPHPAQNNNDPNPAQSVFGEVSQPALGSASQSSFGNMAPPESQSTVYSIPPSQPESIAQPYLEGVSRPAQHDTPPQYGTPSGPAPITLFETNDAFQQAENGVEVGRDSEQDDGYASDGSAASMSLASSARNFIFENGRRYHSFRAGAYSFPNDDREQDREDLKHAMFLKLFNKTLHFAPIPTKGAINAIDLGTGTGIWAIDFADQYPDASVLGIDLSPIQTNWVPPNLKFMVDDAESDWVNPVDHFDYVHTRHTIQAFHDWPRLFERAMTHLKPGGWMECQEIDHFPRCEDSSMAPDDPMVQYWDQVADGLVTTGVNFRLAPKLATYMREAGFVNITERVFFTPIGPWPRNRVMKEVGLYWRAVLMEGLEAIALGPFTRGLGWRKEEVDVFLASVRKAYLDRGTHAYMPFHVIYGQKPMN